MLEETDGVTLDSTGWDCGAQSGGDLVGSRNGSVHRVFPLMHCHHERSEGSAVSLRRQNSRFLVPTHGARNDNPLIRPVFAEASVVMPYTVLNARTSRGR